MFFSNRYIGRKTAASTSTGNKPVHESELYCLIECMFGEVKSYKPKSKKDKNEEIKVEKGEKNEEQKVEKEEKKVEKNEQNGKKDEPS